MFRTGAPLQTVESAPHPDGLHSYEIYKFPLADETGEVAYVAGVGIDITERRLLEDQLRHSQKLEAVGRLAGGVAHDFNNLLTVISGYGHMLLKGIAESDPLHSCVEELLRASTRAAGLTNQLLAFSRRQIIKPQVLDINALVANMDRMLRRVIGEHIHLETSLSVDVGTVMADAGQLEQVLMNLTVNARDAMPQGGTLSIRTMNVDVAPLSHRRSEVRPGSYVVIEVADTGSGIDAESMLHLFEPFYTSKEVGKGTGLGLSTVYGIIKQSGGDVAVESHPAAGTTFRMYLRGAMKPPKFRSRPRLQLSWEALKSSCWWRTKPACGSWCGKCCGRWDTPSWKPPPGKKRFACLRKTPSASICCSPTSSCRA